MTKTEHYQLPQWEPHDPVRRTDFNAANRAIEAGLDSVKRIAADAVTIAGKAQESSIPASIGYNQYLSFLRHAHNGHDLADKLDICCNPLRRAEDIASTGDCYLLKTGGLTVGGGTKLTMALLAETAANWASVELPQVGSTGTASVTFTCPRSGTITGVQLWFNCDQKLGTKMPLTARLYDLADESCVYTSDTLYSVPLYTGDNTCVIAVAMPVQAWHSYRIEFTKTENIAFTGSFGIGVQGEEVLDGTTAEENILTNIAIEPLTLTEEVGTLTGIVRWAGTGELPKLYCGGVEMTPTESRAASSMSGQPCTEQRYTATGPFGGTQEVTMEMQATEEQQLTVFDFGVIAF